MKRNAVISLTLALGLLSGCAAGAAEGLNRPVPTETIAPLPVEETMSAPVVPAETERPGEMSANRLALELLRAEYAQKGGNVILSPLSIETTLSMTSEGASGEAKEALEALGLSAEQGAALSQDDGDNALFIANSM